MRERLFIVLFLVLSFFAFSQPIVIYQLEVVRLSDETITKIGLKEIEISKPDLSAYQFRVTYEPAVMELLLKIPFISTTIEVGTKHEKTMTSVRPWVSTILGKSAVIFAGVDELSLRTGVTTGTGLRVELTPLNIADEKIQTKIAISDPYSPMIFDNELNIGTDFSPICLLTLKTSNGFEYFAVYAKASSIGEPPKENIYMIGSMDNFVNLFNSSSVERTTELYGFLLTDFSNYNGEIGTSIWMSDSITLQSKVLFMPMNFMAGIEALVSEEGLRAGLRFFYDGDFYIAIGVSDYSELSTLLTLFAEFYPFKLSISQLKFVEPSWKVGANFDFDNFVLTLGAYGNADINFWIDGRVKVFNGFYVLAGCRYSLNGEIYLLAGISIKF
ncbi:MAG: hypothetical protein WHT65_05900 [Pseudothermotoga sp.]